MQAVILAAGRGSRLAPYTKDLPKGMLPFHGKALIERQIETLRAIGIGKIVVVTGYRSGSFPFRGVRYRHNEEYDRTNMVVSLMCARADLTTETLVTYADLLYDESLARDAVESPHDIAVVVDRGWRSYWEFRYGSTEEDLESLSLTVDGRIGEIGRSLDSSEGLQYRYVGLVKFSPAGLRRAMKLYDHKGERAERWVQSGQPFPGGCMTDLLHELATGGADVRPVVVEGGWLEFDTPEDYERALELDRQGGLGRFVDLGEGAAGDRGKSRGGKG